MSIHDRLPVTVAIPTYGREQVLLDTIEMFLHQVPRAAEILVVDQTPSHMRETDKRLGDWRRNGQIHWLRLPKPSQPAALNVALRHSRQPYVLFLDDDIRIDQGFVKAHYEAFDSETIWAVAGQVLQPSEEADGQYVHSATSGPFADCDFLFRSGKKVFIQNGMSGNLCVRRERALEIGGFDENFTPPVAYRFDNEFCKRLCRAGGKIVFEPKARIYHLRAQRGGTRSNSNHLTSMSPEHGVGDYYFAFRCARGWRRWRYILRRPLREVLTRFHLNHPWYIPVKLLGEARAFCWACRLAMQGPSLLSPLRRLGSSRETRDE